MVILLLLVPSLRPWWRLVAVIGGIIGLGIAAQALVEAIAPSWTGGSVVEGGRLAGAITNWVVIPAPGHGRFGGFAYVALVVAILILTLLHGWLRTVALVPSVYLAAVVWENSFVEQSAVARWILFGSLLVALMTVRPQGLLGTPRVEIV